MSQEKENILKMTGKENNIVIVGLGNPGSKYESTYHNLGFMVVDSVLKNLNVSKFKKECQAETYTFFQRDKKIIFAKPQTFMNLSGDSVKELAGKYLDSLDNLIVIYDDIDIPSGTIRARVNGSAGTHNGMKNIVDRLSDKNFKRIRIGFGGETNIPLINKVLSKINSEKDKEVLLAVEKAGKLIEEYLKDFNFDKLMIGANTK